MAKSKKYLNIKGGFLVKPYETILKDFEVSSKHDYMHALNIVTTETTSCLFTFISQRILLILETF